MYTATVDRRHLNPNETPIEFIEEFARVQLAKWNLTDWTFVWDNARRRYGQCRHIKREISLSRILTSMNDIEQSIDTVLHEIAHALAGRGQGHNHVWKQWCIKVGAQPQRCFTSTVNGGQVDTPKGKWRLVHVDTGEVFRHYHRKPRRKLGIQRGVWWRGRKNETLDKLQIVEA
jgi:hypothetical protein